MRGSYCCCVLFAGALIGAAALLAAAATLPATQELEEDHELSMEFETPHTDWAQPYALGKVRVLYFGWGSYDRGIEARDIVELMQRFDIEAKAAYYHRIIDSPETEWCGGEAGVQRILGLLDEHWDCFVFAGVPPTQLPNEAQFKMYQKVTEGAGIVLVGVDDQRALKPPNELTDPSGFLAREPVGEAYRIKAGRGIRLPARPQVEYHPGWEVDYDYWLERVGRAVLWAAKKWPRLELTVAAARAPVDRSEASAHPVYVRYESAPWSDANVLVKGVTLEARLRRSDGDVVGLAHSCQLGAGGGEIAFPLSVRYPADRYHFDVIARSEDGVEAWASAPLEIISHRTVETVELERPWGEVGDKIAGLVRLDGSPGADEGVRVQLLDANQRVLAQRDAPLRDSAAGFEFMVEDWMPMVLEVRALVTDRVREAASAYTYFRVTRRNHGRFNFVVWDWPTDTLAPYVEEQLARLGCTVQLRGGAPDEVVAASNIAQIPYTTRIMTTWDDNGYMLPTCWNDEPAVDEWVESIVSKYEPSRQHGVFVYSLGDETATTGSCVHPACLAAYRRYLQQEYGDIAALNRSWGSDYASFDQVGLSAPRDNDEAQALGARLYARWYDRQAFKGYNFVRLCERFDRRFKELDPQALTGFEGAGTFSDGTDIDLICRTNGFWSPYPGMADEVVRSIASRNFIRSNWMGYTKDADSLLGQYWRMVTRGADSVWWWRWDGFGAYRGLLAPHLAPWRAIKEMQRDTQIVRDGLGDLLLQSERQDDRIAILYSYPSSFANKLEAGPSYGKYEDDHAAWQRTLRALGLQFSYVTDRMLRQGEFRARRYKVLILPQAEAIGPLEAEAIRDFAAQGGTVIADVRPGLYDHHCKPLDRGLLDAVFGIVRTGNEQAVVGDGSISGAAGLSPIAFSLAGVRADPAVRATQGQALGGAGAAPLLVVNQVGHGRAVLLNFAMSSFPDLRDPDNPPAAADFAAALLASAGVEPAVKVTDAAGRAVRDTEVIRWRGRGVDLLAVFGGKDEMVNLTLPYAQHVYDLRERAYRGLRQVFGVHNLPTRATFVALSPTRLSAPDVVLSDSRVERGQRLAVRLSYGASRARHAAAIRVHQPGGMHAEWFDQVVVVEPEGTDIVLPIAYNDATGAWTVRAVDLYTNEAAEARFVVE